MIPRRTLPLLLASILSLLFLQRAISSELLRSPSSLPAPLDSGFVARTNDWLVNASNVHASVRRGRDSNTLTLGNGLVRRTFRIGTTAGTVGLDNLMTGNSMLRALCPEARITIDGKVQDIGGFSGQPDRAYLLPSWIDQATNTPSNFRFKGFAVAHITTPFVWKSPRHHANLPWPPTGAAIDFVFEGTTPETSQIEVTIHYECYDGAPVIGKWFAISNHGDRAIRLNRFELERLPIVEAESAVDDRKGIAWRVPSIDVLSDYMFHGMDSVTGNQVASWVKDSAYTSQVSYLLDTPCVLLVQPPLGPDAEIAPQEQFTSFRSYLVIHDSTERERQGLTMRHAQRLLAPWITENPIMMHVRDSDSKAFRLAVDQCAEVGFEMIIYTFGSGLNMENENPDYLAKVKADVDYAHAKGLQVGAYSLFSSRSAGPENDVIDPKTGKPGGAIFGQAPCFGSKWGEIYFQKLTNFISATGLDLLENDGPYPGDLCASTNHPGHHGLEDSQWVNWRMSANLYEWCRARGVYVNQPDYYFLAGGSKTAMGYREDNWSLPRAQQFIHARQHIYDGTWTKPQTAGWLFVPLTEYHGGGSAATLEPLKDHLPDYENHLAINFGDGVQACWRGPRLYDSEETRDLVRKWVTFYKEHRDILESDIIHCRRADGRDIDYLLHVNPNLPERAFAMIHNPLPTNVTRTIKLPLYYTGLSRSARISIENNPAKTYPLNLQSEAFINVEIPANSQTWVVVKEK